MENFKKLVAVFLTLTMVMSLSVTAFAAENDGTSEPEWHTIEITLEPGETVSDESSGIMPLMWEQKSPTVAPNNTVSTTSFTIDSNHRYFAYETYATDTNGNAVSGTYTVKLVYCLSNTIINTYTCSPNNQTYKNDWISVVAGGNYYFKIVNNTSTSLKVYLTYYSFSG